MQGACRQIAASMKKYALLNAMLSLLLFCVADAACCRGVASAAMLCSIGVYGFAKLMQYTAAKIE